MSHVTGYPTRSRNKSCDRHTATATRSPPHGHRHTATATRPPPHGHRHTATATRPPPHGHRHTATATRPPPHSHCHTTTATQPSHPWPGHVPGHVPGYMISYVINYIPGYIGTFNHGNLPRPLALGYFWRSLALWHPWPLLPFGPWPLFPRGQYPLSTMADGGLCLLAALSTCGALGPWRPLIYGGLWPMGHPWPQ